jgi:hypothetical protein
LILKIFLGLKVLFWGYEKLEVEKLTKSYKMDYGGFMLIDVQTFLQFAGWDLFNYGTVKPDAGRHRCHDGCVAIIVPGLIIMKDVPHFAYAFAFTGGSLVIFIEGSSPFFYLNPSNAKKME